MTKEFFEKLYLQENKTLRQIEAITGITYTKLRKTIFPYYKIPLRKRGNHYTVPHRKYKSVKYKDGSIII